MRLIVITPTCRTEPRFRDMANTLAGNLSLTPVNLTWVVVDDRLWPGPGRDPEARRAELLEAVDGRFEVVHLEPKPSAVRGPSRTTDEDLPDHNNARNSGLAAVLALVADTKGVYVIYLDDNTVVGQSLFAVATEAADADVCLRVPIHFKRDLDIPRDGKITVGESGGMKLVKCFATTAAGGCFGAPLRALLAIAGFDEVYAGDRGKQDLDAFVRMERAGWSWMTSARCSAIQLAKTHTTEELGRHTPNGRNNTGHWQNLMRDRARKLPVTGCDLMAVADELREGWQPHEELREPAPLAPVGT